MDPSIRRLALLDKQLHNWPESHHKHLLFQKQARLEVCLRLLRVIRALPAGLLVFPDMMGHRLAKMT